MISISWDKFYCLHCLCFATKCKTNIWQKKIMQGANHTCFFWTNNFLCIGPPSKTWGNFESEGCWRRVAKFSFCKQTIENNGLFRIFHGVHCNHTILSKWDLGWKGLAEHVFLEGENGRPNIIQSECNCPKMTFFFNEKTCQKWKIGVAARLDRKDSAATANLIPQSTKSTHRFCSLTTSRSCRIKNLATRGRLSEAVLYVETMSIVRLLPRTDEDMEDGVVADESKEHFLRYGTMVVVVRTVIWHKNPKKIDNILMTVSSRQSEQKTLWNVSTTLPPIVLTTFFLLWQSYVGMWNDEFNELDTPYLGFGPGSPTFTTTLPSVTASQSDGCSKALCMWVKIW